MHIYDFIYSSDRQFFILLMSIRCILVIEHERFQLYYMALFLLTLHGSYSTTRR
jgi:hypothetical protein